MKRFHRPLRIWLCVSLTSLASAGVLAAPAPAPIWPSGPTYRIARFADKPDWRQAETIGPLFLKGEPEAPQRRTEIQLALVNDTLHIRATCFEPEPDKIKGPDKDTPIWVADSLEFLFTESPERRFPCLHLTVGARGDVTLVRYLLPFGTWAKPLTENPDPSHIRLKTAIDRTAWRATLAIPLKTYGITGESFFGNILRNRFADRSSYGWVDLWAGRFQRLRRLGRMTVVKPPLDPLPRLPLPASLAVGTNPLTLENWQPRCRFLVNGKPVTVNVRGESAAHIDRHGPAELEIVRDDGSSVARYAAEVRRALIFSADEPFANDPAKPLPVHLSLTVAHGASAKVTLEAVQGKRSVGRTKSALRSGSHALSIPLTGAKPGEVQILARAELPAAPGKPVTLSARHWCVLGLDRSAFDKFRPGIDNLRTRSMCRAGVADAAGYYRLIQAGNGEVRSGRRRGRYGFRFWNHGFIYVLALAYEADWPENPHRGDKRFLTAAALGMEAALEPERWQTMLDFPPNRNLQPWLLTYELLKDDVPAEQAEYWRRGLTRLVETVVECWVRPASFRHSNYSVDVGTGTNHYAYHAANVYTAGRVLDRGDWLKLGREMMRRLAAHEKDGQFPERRDVPASRYTWLTMNALGEYYRQSRDETVRDALLRCVDYSCHSSLPDGGATMLHDGRMNGRYASHFGDFVLSLKPAGRALARVRARTYINAGRTPGRTGPERWFRAAENAVYFEPGEETPLPEDAAFAFLDGRGLIARKSGFIYGLSAISVPPIDGLFRLDPQNTVEWHHIRAGCILNGANSQQQPQAGSFFRKLADRTVFLPSSGDVHRTLDGHVARLQFDTFEATLACRVLSRKTGEVKVELLNATGPEPVVFNFFPGVNAREALDLSKDAKTIRFRNVTIACSRPVKLDRNLRIFNPYSGRHQTGSKPVRAYANLEVRKPLVLHITVDEP